MKTRNLLRSQLKALLTANGRTLLLAGLAVLVVLPAHAARLALVVGNASYVDSPLKNPVNDARAMQNKLQRLGFEVTQVENFKRRDIGRTVNGFATKIRPGDEVVVFYAGHGVQVKGINYLPAVDAEIQSEEDVPLNSLNLSNLLERLDEAKAGVKILLLDACRNNPYARSFRSGSRGLARVQDAPSGTLMHFATRPGSVAADGTGSNGLYTTELLRSIDEPGVPIEQLLKRVSAAVEKASKGQQEPWVEGSLKGDFYFKAGSGTQVASITPVPTGVPEQRDPEIDAWEMAQRANTAAMYNAYLSEYPRGRYASTARVALAGLTPSAAPAAVPTAAPAATQIAEPADPATAAMFNGKTITIIVPFAAGSSIDSDARALASVLSRDLAAAVVVDNVPGASGVLGTKRLLSSSPDGLTLMLHNTGYVVSPHLMQSTGYQPSSSFEMVGMATEAPWVVAVRPGTNAAQAKTYASGGTGTGSHLCGASVLKSMSPQAFHVPYRGIGPGMADLMAGHIDVICDSATSLLPSISSGKLQAVGITKTSSLPSLSGVNLVPGGGTDWTGLFAPKGTPAAVVKRLNQALIKAGQDAGYVQQLGQRGRSVINDSRVNPSGQSQFISDEWNKWSFMKQFQS
ncbi:hypothetical protein G7048_23650 [Diaphorobacter sp. HDW4B]|uniref:tripartite tricarboxylate transporter substrate-binding protein n=1 Tax=Diaphorobacter sp. HDW4B TaxID=2714925 RepID=UPI0014076B00|nr:tripartite tricarboxylate transporter substrate-binding protein [Diaphorobacter sp. HDW4B]QIL73083.1 hypothetical protein G7048_23650 [Diaphorobacter sp. HDW4B]